jgi:hypothetical protein
LEQYAREINKRQKRIFFIYKKLEILFAKIVNAISLPKPAIHNIRIILYF